MENDILDKPMYQKPEIETFVVDASTQGLGGGGPDFGSELS